MEEFFCLKQPCRKHRPLCSVTCTPAGFVRITESGRELQTILSASWFRASRMRQVPNVRLGSRTTSLSCGAGGQRMTVLECKSTPDNNALQLTKPAQAPELRS